MTLKRSDRRSQPRCLGLRIGLLLTGVGIVALALVPSATAATGTGSISGRVVDAVTGEGVAGIRVYPASITWQPNGLWDLTVTTAEDGSYTIPNVPPDSYLARAWDPNEVYGSYDYPDVPNFDADFYWVWATRVPVVAGVDSKGIDVGVSRLVHFSGRVTDAATGEGAPADVPVEIWRLDERSGRWWNTGGVRNSWDGKWAPGYYRLRAAPNSETYAYQWFGGDSLGESIVLTATSGASIDVTMPLAPGGLVTGVVYGPDGATPMGGARVAAFVLDDTIGAWEEIDATWADAQGAYSLPRMPAGPFRLGAGAPGYAFTFFGGSVLPGAAVDIVLGPSAQARSAKSVTRAASGQSSFDVRLAGRGGGVSGTVFCADSRPPASAVVEALRWDAASSKWVVVGAPTATGADGSYQLQLPAGSYKIRFRRNGCGTRYNGGAWSASSARYLAVVDGVTVPGVNATLISGGACVARVPSRVTWGTTGAAVFSIRDWMNEPVSGTPFLLQRSTDGRTFVTALKTTSAGPSFTVALATSAKRTYFKWAFPGQIAGPKTVVVARRAYLTTPWSISSVRRYSDFSARGLLRPGHTPGTSPVTIRAYRYESGTWRLKTSVAARVTRKDSRTSAYSARLRLGPGRWQLRAYHGEDAYHVATASGLRNVVVK